MKKQLPLLTLALLLAACGGGGGGDNAATDQPTPRPDGSARDPLFIISSEPDDYSDYQHFDFILSSGRYAYISDAERRAVIDPNLLPRGLSGEQTMRLQAQRKADGGVESEDLKARSYRGFHSGILLTDKTKIIQESSQTTPEEFAIPYWTAVTNLPNTGRTTYHGNAFGLQADNIAALAYHVDFGRKTGHGTIAANAYHPSIELKQSSIHQKTDSGITYYEIDGELEIPGYFGQDYEILFGGPNAEEVIGAAYFNKYNEDTTLGLHGTRGNITP